MFFTQLQFTLKLHPDGTDVIDPLATGLSLQISKNKGQRVQKPFYTIYLPLVCEMLFCHYFSDIAVPDSSSSNFRKL